MGGRSEGKREEMEIITDYKDVGWLPAAAGYSGE